MNCKYCGARCQKAGCQKNGTQKYYCRLCKKYQQNNYRYSACQAGIMTMIPALVKESVSIRGIARVLKIAVQTVITKIRTIAGKIVKPPVPFNRQSFELDEVRTYIRKKENQYWIAYALCSESKQVVDFVVGKRSKRTLRMIVNTLLISNVKIIKTDKLNIYQSLIPQSRHISHAYNINH